MMAAPLHNLPRRPAPTLRLVATEAPDRRSERRFSIYRAVSWVGVLAFCLLIWFAVLREIGSLVHPR